VTAAAELARHAHNFYMWAHTVQAHLAQERGTEPPPEVGTPEALQHAWPSIKHNLQNLDPFDGKSLCDAIAVEYYHAAAQRQQPHGAENSSPIEDKTAYRLANEFLDEKRFPEIRDLHKALNENPWIRQDRPATKQGTPDPHRFVIHAGDWHEYLVRRAKEDAAVAAKAREAAAKLLEQATRKKQEDAERRRRAWE
jgi:hypothetical protein